MTKTLTIDEMIAVLHFEGQADSVKRWKAEAEALADRIADEINNFYTASMQPVIVGKAHADWPNVGGTCATFEPTFPGQACPAGLTHFDQDEWDDSDLAETIESMSRLYLKGAPIEKLKSVIVDTFGSVQMPSIDCPEWDEMTTTDRKQWLHKYVATVHYMQKKFFSVFCVKAHDLESGVSRAGTVFFTVVEALSPAHAGAVAIEECADTWDTEPEDLAVLGIKEGEIDFTVWNASN